MHWLSEWQFHLLCFVFFLNFIYLLSASPAFWVHLLCAYTLCTPIFLYELISVPCSCHAVLQRLKKNSQRHIRNYRPTSNDEHNRLQSRNCLSLTISWKSQKCTEPNHSLLAYALCICMACVDTTIQLPSCTGIMTLTTLLFISVHFRDVVSRL